MSYHLPGNIDCNKIFLIDRSAILERLDPSVYKPMFFYSSKKYKVFKLSTLAWIDPITDFSKLNPDTEVSFVPMESIDAGNGIINSYRKIKVGESKGYTRFQENDLLWAKITPCMQNGKSAIARNLLKGVGCGSTEYFVIRPKSEDILVEYLHFLLRNKKILLSAMNYFGGSAGQQRVSSIFLENFQVPLPPIEVQQQICDQITQTYITKQEKEAKAKYLLSSIDSYLLKELGIILPFQKKIEDVSDKLNSLINSGRLFFVDYRDITGKRIDPKIYNKDTVLLKQAISNSKYNCIKLGTFITHYCSGDWGKDENDVLVDESGNYTRCLVIRATEFDNNDNLRLDNDRAKYRLINTDKLEKLNIKENDILFEKSGGSKDQPVGRVAILTKDIINSYANKLAFSNFIAKNSFKRGCFAGIYIQFFKSYA